MVFFLAEPSAAVKERDRHSTRGEVHAGSHGQRRRTARLL